LNQIIALSTTEVANSPDPHVSSGIGALGINTTSLIFQIINFIILYLVLKKFLFKPIASALEQRKQIIQDSLNKAKAIDEEKKSIDEEQRKILNDSLQKADLVISEAKKQADAIKEEMLITTKQEQDRILQSTKKEIEAIKMKSLDEAKKEIANLVITVTKKVTHEVIKISDNDEIVNRTIKDIK
jgi:F-type H+-transporting ATPase subunit b